MPRMSAKSLLFALVAKWHDLLALNPEARKRQERLQRRRRRRRRRRRGRARRLPGRHLRYRFSSVGVRFPVHVRNRKTDEEQKGEENEGPAIAQKGEVEEAPAIAAPSGAEEKGEVEEAPAIAEASGADVPAGGWSKVYCSRRKRFLQGRRLRRWVRRMMLRRRRRERARTRLRQSRANRLRLRRVWAAERRELVERERL